MIRIESFVQARELLTRRISGGFLADFGETNSAEQIVRKIINNVRTEGDEALFRYTRELDGVELASLEVSRAEIQTAYETIDKKLVSALKLASDRIRDFHLSCMREKGLVSFGPNMGRHLLPMEKAGVYVPGGTAAYPSTVLMTAIPAQVAGVKEIIMASPPNKEGVLPPATLVAADIAGVQRIFKIGGAQAIAAMAFGTESVPKVDKICGPGNIFVVLAKKAVYGTVGIDGLQGPSEIMIVADEKASPKFCAADMLAQAEHDALAQAVLVTTSSVLADQVEEEIHRQIKLVGRASIIAGALDKSMIIIVSDLGEAVDLVNLFAPEHLSLATENAASLLAEIRNAGCIFVGGDSPVAIGDYIAGPSHVLPTGGSARFSSSLGVDDFLKFSNFVDLDEALLRELADAAMVIAESEGLDAHARAIACRREEQ
jgi:histidinol dehydrogenase